MLGVAEVFSKNVFVSSNGEDKGGCGNWSSPCRSVRHAVKISSANDVIYIDYASGRPYRECKHPENIDGTIMLDKSLSFYGFKGTPQLYCEQTYTFFGINSSELIIPKIIFSNLSFVGSGGLLNGVYKISSKFEVEFNFCDIKRSLYVVKASSVSCSIQVLNSIIQSYSDPISANCNNLTVRLTESTFFSCHIKLSAEREKNNSKPETNICIYNCTFNTIKKPSNCTSLIAVIAGTAICNVTIKSSTFANFYSLAAKSSALMISSLVGRVKTTIVLDNLHFENVTCNSAVIYLHLLENPKIILFNVGIFNSIFINTTRAFQCYVDQFSVIPFFGRNIILHNNTFNNTSGVRKESLMYLVSGRYHFALCRFFHSVPMYNPDFPLIRVESSVTVTLENVSYSSYSIDESCYSNNVHMFNSNMYYIISYESHTNYFVMKGDVIISCPQGYRINYNRKCQKSGNLTSCDLYRASCEQCGPKTYSLEKGIVHNNIANKITCHECPLGGNCLGGQITSKRNFWGYKSNQTVKFLQCPPKYCCDTDYCEHYYSCQGNREGTLCGKCRSEMSESLFDTKCKASKDCKSVLFWPGTSAYLILYLVFFLYQDVICSCLLTRFISKVFLHDRNTKPGGLMKIIFYYYQVVHLLRNSVGSSEKVPILYDTETFLSRLFNFLIIGISYFDCPFPDLRPVLKAVITHSVGYCLLIMLCLLYFFTFIFKKLQKLRIRSTLQTVGHTETNEQTIDPPNIPFVNRISGAFVSISLLMYSSATHLCLLLLHCVPVGNNQVLFLDGNIKCYRTFQNFLFGYVISCIIPFCLVPVLGSYLLKLNRISVAQFCAACILPLPFFPYWLYLLVRNSSWCMRHLVRFNTNGNGATTVADDQRREEEVELRWSNSAVLYVLLGPFRQHHAAFLLPSSHIPWEGFLIFRRFALISVLTFVFDNQMKAILSTILFVAILLIHVFVRPFKATKDNVLETLSLGTLIIISLLTLVKGFYFGDDLHSAQGLLFTVNLMENILVIFPIALIVSLIIISIFLKLVVMFRLGFQALFRRLKLHIDSDAGENNSLIHHSGQE